MSRRRVSSKPQTSEHSISIHIWPWSTKAVISNMYICSNSQKYIVWVKMIDFSFMPKIIRILIKDHVPWRYFVNFLPYIYQNFSKIKIIWLVICIAKNFIWTTLKAIFSIFVFYAPSDCRYSNSCISSNIVL